MKSVCVRVCLLSLFFSRFSLAEDVFQSNESPDSPSQKYFTTVQEITVEKGTNKETSHVVTKQNVLDDLCRFHSDFPPFSFLGSVSDNPASNIQVRHDIFDTSFGLVPQISYSVQIVARVAEFSILQRENYAFALQVSEGKLSPLSVPSSSWWCGTSAERAHQLVFSSAPANFTFIISSYPDAPTLLTFRLFALNVESRNVVALEEKNTTVLPGCYLKLHSSHGVVSSSHLPLHFNSEHNLLSRSSTDCSLLLTVPTDFTAELTLRKLKLKEIFRPQVRDCHTDSQLQWMSSTTWETSFENQTVHGQTFHQSANQNVSWSTLADYNQQSRKTERSFCGKLQDYTKSYRTWRTTDPFIVIRYRNGDRNQSMITSGMGNSFFAFKFNVVGPCSNQLFTDDSKTIEFSSSILAQTGTLECSFGIHLPYGYRVHLSIQLLLLKSKEKYKIPLRNLTGSSNDDLTANKNSRIIQNTQCDVVVEVEDVTGHKVDCLNNRNPSASFSSMNNMLTFFSIIIPRGQVQSASDIGNDLQEINVVDEHEIHLRVQYSSVADLSLTRGCSNGVAASENTCIWFHSETLPWQEAEMKCNQLARDGHLVSITDSSIQKAVDAVVTFSPHFEPTNSFWIGGSDQKQETVFEWSSGDEFVFKNWFPGWRLYHDYNAQPSDDGYSMQDCIELRQSFGQPGHNEMLANGLYWNDRDCSVRNAFVCQSPKQSLKFNEKNQLSDTLVCNRSEKLNRYQTSIIVESPSYPRSYPKASSCTVDITAPIGFKILLNFNSFDLEEEEDCNYDSLEITDLFYSYDNKKGLASWKRCGNWNSKLKMLRWRSSTNRVQIKFTSDSSYSGSGFQLQATLEKSEINCPESGSIHQGHCYLIVPFPEIGFSEASYACRAIQAELVLPDRNEELEYLSRMLKSDNQFNATAFYWIGQPSRFQLSVTQSNHASDQCPSLRSWSGNSNTSLESCHSVGGYICEKTLKSHYGAARNSSIESREGEVKSPNYPALYSEGNHFRLHIKVPNASSHSDRVVVRFKKIDVEFQEACLYDYIGLQSTENGEMQKICGHYTTNLDRFDYISDTSELFLTFFSDYSVAGNGFHLRWSTLQLEGCPNKTISEPQGELFSPNFPHYYLPHLNCTYHLLAPKDTRVWIKFHLVEVGTQSPRKQLACRYEYLRVSWENSSSDVILCGNTTRNSMQWISDGNHLLVQLVSFKGKDGRGFHASYRFEPIPTVIKDFVMIKAKEKLDVIPFNHPLSMPIQLRHRVSFSTHHGSFLHFQPSHWLIPCEANLYESAFVVVLIDVYNNNTEIELCRGKDAVEYSSKPQFESLFHSLIIEYERFKYNESFTIESLGSITSIEDKSYSRKVADFSADLLLDTCDRTTCQHGACTPIEDHYYCKCNDKWKGLFCSLTLCEFESSCHHGSCIAFGNGTEYCNCDPEFTGEFCESRLAPCDLDPCGDRGKCVPTIDGQFICQCNPWWLGPRCENRWVHVPYKPLSQRMLEEPFWLGLITITIVLVVIAIVWCVKRHFAEKFDNFVTQEFERGKLVEPAMMDWARGRQISAHCLNIEAVSSSRPASPQLSANVPPSEGGQRHFLGWQGFRKPSLLSITSLISPSPSHTSVNGPAITSARNRVTNGQRDGRTFSLDDLLRLPKRSPSPSSRGSDNDVASQRRKAERQQILQRLIASQIPNDGSIGSSGETVMMKSLGGRRVFSANEQSVEVELERVETRLCSQMSLDPKAEKKVTFARMMELVKADISSSETDISVGEEIHKSKEGDVKKFTVLDNRRAKQKNSSWSSRRLWRSNNSNSSTQGSASDQEISHEIPFLENATSSSDIATAECGQNQNRHLRLPRAISTFGRKASSTESLLTIIRNLSGSNHKSPSTPSSPQVSDYELSSSFQTPLSTPGSISGSLEAISQSSINSSEIVAVQVSVIHGENYSSPTQRNNRNSGPNLHSSGSSHITLDIPTNNYSFLSPIHEVPTPLPSPMHTPNPSLRRQSGVAETSFSTSNLSQAHCKPEIEYQRSIHSDDSRSSSSSTPSIMISQIDEGNLQSESNISVLVPPLIQINVESVDSSSLPSPGKSKPPPLHIMNSNFTRFQSESAILPALPMLCVSSPPPESTDSENESTVHVEAIEMTQSKPLLNWKHISIGSPPVRKNTLIDAGLSDRVIRDDNTTKIDFRRPFKDTHDKSSSLDLCHPPPMITVTTNFCSEIESDTDTGQLGRIGMNSHQVNMCYLSPLVHYSAGRTNIATSESNLSSSGYSSMASPGPSPSCSSKTLLEEDMILRRRGFVKGTRTMFHQVLSPSLESSSPPPESPLEKPLGAYCFSEKHSAVLPSDSEVTDEHIEPIEHESTADYESNDDILDPYGIREKIDSGELKSAKDLENFFTSVRSPIVDHSANDQILLNLIRVQKSTSLDSKLVGQRRNNLKSDSLDTKLFSLQTMAPSSLQLPESSKQFCSDGNHDDRKRGSPVSSRSESPLSDAKSVGIGRFSSHFYGKSRADLQSVYTDSDLYDYPSSERSVLPSINTPRRHARKCDLKRRERKKSLSRQDHLVDKEVLITRSSLLDPNIDRGKNRKTKRRVRAQNFLDFSSSSKESLAERQRKKSPRPQLVTYHRGSFPTCGVILTVQAASSPECSEDFVKEVNDKSQCSPSDLNLDYTYFKLPGRNRQFNQTQTSCRGLARRRKEISSQRRRGSSSGACIKKVQGATRKVKSQTKELNAHAISTKEDSSSSCDIENGSSDSNESLANITD